MYGINGSRRTSIWRFLRTRPENVTQLETRLKTPPFDVTEPALLAMKNLNFLQEGSLVYLVLVSPVNFAIRSAAQYLKFTIAARNAGFAFCQPEFAVFLRLAYLNQVSGESLIVATQPISTKNGGQILFEIANYRGVLRLSTITGEKNTEWAPNTRFVFTRVIKIR